MHLFNPRLASAALFSATLLGGTVGSVSAAPEADGHVVFVQSNDPTTNQVLAYHQAADGALKQFAAIDTGGMGGRLMGAAADPLASQGSLRFDARADLLIGVNAGSNTIYDFHVDHGQLSRRQVLPSGGEFPVGIAVHGDLVYALNARGTGSVSGFRVDGHGDLTPIPGSTRDLHLSPNPTSTEFLTTPGQVGFSPEGDQLIVTTKNNGSHIDIFRVRDDGSLSATPVVNASQTPVPFAFSFDAQQQLVVVEAGASHVSTYRLKDDGSIIPIGTATDSQSAACWVSRDGNTYFVSNAGSGSVSSFRVNPDGDPTLLQTTNVGPGAVDSTLSDGRFLYVELGGNGTVAELHVQNDGTLSSIGSVAGHMGEEGIVAL